MKNFFALLAASIIVLLFAVNVPACEVNAGAGSQTCQYRLTWDWNQGEGPLADGYIMQQMVDNNGTWSDIGEPVTPSTNRLYIDRIFNDKGGRAISWRVLAFRNDSTLGQVRSGPSNIVSIITPVIKLGPPAAPGGLNVTLEIKVSIIGPSNAVVTP